MISPSYIFRIARISLLCVLACSDAGFAQATGNLRGKVTDPTGAVIPGATVTAKSASGQTATATSGGDGSYEIKGLAPGQYTVSATSKGFSPFVKDSVSVLGGRAQALDIPLDIQVIEEKVQVEAEGNTLDTAPANNASSVVLRGKDLEALSDDPDELQNELQALAGPSAGPNGGQMYIDGFTAGQLPPKSAIREIRINQNPFSAQYDKLGYGRIEIFTKPGSDKFHGQFQFNENNSIFNSKNPFISNEPDYHTEIFEGNFGGPLGKKASFFLDGQRRNINDVDIVSPRCGSIVLAECAQQTLPNPRTRTNISPRIDYQLTNSNTVTARYQFFDVNEQNDNIGQVSGSQIVLPSAGYNRDNSEHQIQIGDTQVLSSKVVNETRFQYLHDHQEWNPFSTAPQLVVSGFFVTGGSSMGHELDDENHYEIQNYTSVSSGNHSTRFGARVRISQVSDQIPGNFNGTFSYPSLIAYQDNQPNQFSIAAGQPLISNTFTDVGLYAEDDWKMRSNLTVSYGLRYETQNAINDHHDFAPRIGVAWGLGRKGGSPSTVVRAGYGIFYDRFPQNLVLQAERYNGTNQQLYVVDGPSFGPGNIPSSFAGLAGKPSTIYQIDPNLRAPYVMQSALGIERQVSKAAKVSLTYLNSRGMHQLFLDNINAPLPGTYPAGPLCPLGCGAGSVYQYQSEGIFKQNQLIANINLRYNANISLFGFYTLNYANSDTSGPNSFIMDPYDPSLDYGRASFDTRHRLFLGGNFAVPFGLQLFPFIFAQSGSPYNITVPEDIFGTAQFNARPGFAVGSAGCSTLSTTNPFCFFIPSAGQPYTPIPANLGQGPANISVNLRVSKTFGFGPEAGGGRANRGGGGGGGGHERGGPMFGGFGGGPGRGMFGGGGTDRRYSLTFSVQALNMFNHPNLANPVGVLTPQAYTAGSDFGQSIALNSGGPGFGTQAASRRVMLQVRFAF